MAAGLIQLASKNSEDLYLTIEPEVTFFKVIYKRYTNFSQELIPLNFNTNVKFGSQSNCKISHNGDLINKIYFKTTLPSIPILFDSVTGDEEDVLRYAWAKKIGYALIKSIELEIGGVTVDKQYGEFMSIWYELSETIVKGSLDQLIGNISDLYSFTNGKDGYELLIPLNFWFCENVGTSLPIVGMNYNDVKINLTCAKLDTVLRRNATDYIELDENICHFSEGDVIYQTVSDTVYNIFSHFDYNTNRLYYIKYNTEFLALDGVSDTYKIYNSAGYFVNPVSASVVNSVSELNLSLSNSKLLVNYIFLDNTERYKFITKTHEYLINILSFQGESRVIDSSFKIKSGFSQLSKEIFCVAQYEKIARNNIKDGFNYTNGLYSTSDSLINKISFLLNGVYRTTITDFQYFNYINPLYYHTASPTEGINVYSFSLDPENNTPKGTCNFSEIDDISYIVELNGTVNATNAVLFKIYNSSYNILRINNGLCEILFSN